MKLLSLLMLSFIMMLFASCQTVKPSQPLKLPLIGVQLWSIKEAIAQDFVGNLKRIADMGFDGVEFAEDYGPYKDDPEGLRRLMNELGLLCSSAHINFSYLSEENIADTVAFFKALECATLIVPWEPRAWDATQVRDVISELSNHAATLAKHNIALGYHNHDHELKAFEGATFWDAIASETDKRVVLQLDVGWVTYAGLDPVVFLKRYPGRTFTTHYKAIIPPAVTGRKPIIGQDVTDWHAVLDATVTYGGTQWIIVEQENYLEGITPMQSVEASFKGLKNIMSQWLMKKL